MNMSQQKDNSFMCDINISRASRWREEIITLCLLYLECFTQPQYKYRKDLNKLEQGQKWTTEMVGVWLGFGVLVL